VTAARKPSGSACEYRLCVWRLRLAFGQFAQVQFDWQRVLPDAAESCGFQFQHPDLSEALKLILMANQVQPLASG
jgi:NAD dependent epimerase/dehydratase family enzyme